MQMFLEEKKIWQETFLNNLIQLLHDGNKQVDALKLRESLKKRGNDLPISEIQLALKTVRTYGNLGIYTADLERVQAVGELIFGKKQGAQGLSNSEAIEVDAFVFHSKYVLLYEYNDANQVVLGPVEQAYGFKMSDDNLSLDPLNDKKSFMEEQLPKLAYPLLSLYCTRKIIKEQASIGYASNLVPKQLFFLSELDRLFSKLVSKERVTDKLYLDFAVEYQAILAATPKDILESTAYLHREMAAWQIKHIRPAVNFHLLQDLLTPFSVVSTSSAAALDMAATWVQKQGASLIKSKWFWSSAAANTAVDEPQEAASATAFSNQ